MVPIYGSRINTLLAVAGSIPDQSENCEAPVNIRHVHGTRDNVMDYPFGPGGAVEGAVALWREQNRCGPKADSLEKWHMKHSTSANKSSFGLEKVHIDSLNPAPYNPRVTLKPGDK